MKFPPETETREKSIVIPLSYETEDSLFYIDKLKFGIGREEILTRFFPGLTREKLDKVLDCDLPQPDYPAPPFNFVKKKIVLNNVEFCSTSFTDSSMGGRRVKHYLYSVKRNNEYLLLEFQLLYLDHQHGESKPDSYLHFEETEESKKIQNLINQILLTFRVL